MVFVNWVQRFVRNRLFPAIGRRRSFSVCHVAVVSAHRHGLRPLSQAEQLETRTLLAAVSWDGGGGNLNWGTALNWSTDAVPDSNDDVTIDVPGDVTITHSSGSNTVKSLQCEEALVVSGGSLAVTEDSSIDGGVILNGGTLRGNGLVTLGGHSELNTNGSLTGTVSVIGTLNWTDGTVFGPAFGGSGALTIASGGVLNISGSSQKTNLDYTILNAGTVVWTGTGNIGTQNNAVFNNQAGGLFDAQSNAIFSGGVGGPVFINAGTLRKSAGNGNTQVDVPFNNIGGTIDVSSGTLQFHAGGTRIPCGGHEHRWDICSGRWPLR